MSAAAMTKSHLQDADMQAAPAALIRASQRARELATKTGTPFVVVEAGKLTKEIPKQGA
ncbi:hypothetical protein [Fluviibacter phosphoraccumulans]|jgi:hypothetical protein|uniref:Uncharacterized protein n=1 Tax=Fluviibacter phosphoraccumulans TaxID=1751046 RepID=A0A7R6R2R0_9RHOO|nr:hypothetical protein [Fluviibacter phosphoraccumulans]BBU67919.1 hypothetical protein ICHIAU1_02020 [Fluviibacter phosphoraccumulans]BBU70542.1 hypothetical protein ICHIJ1_04610 [Fluviibacter phosphoraccumulans]